MDLHTLFQYYFGKNPETNLEFVSIFIRLTLSCLFGFYTSQVSHLTFTANMLALSFKIPKIFFRILYGRPKEESSFLDWKNIFFDKLKIPQDAGIYAPAIESSPRDPSHKSIILIREWNNACINLVSSLEMITETELSKYRIQHPLMGRV